MPPIEICRVPTWTTTCSFARHYTLDFTILLSSFDHFLATQLLKVATSGNPQLSAGISVLSLFLPVSRNIETGTSCFGFCMDGLASPLHAVHCGMHHLLSPALSCLGPSPFLCVYCVASCLAPCLPSVPPSMCGTMLAVSPLAYP